MREPDEWEVVEYVRNALDDLRKRLAAGAEGVGATFDADDCQKILGCLIDPQFPNHRPPDHLQDIAIFMNYSLRRSKMSRAQAVAETAQILGESKWTINRALRVNNVEEVK